MRDSEGLVQGDLFWFRGFRGAREVHHEDRLVLLSSQRAFHPPRRLLLCLPVLQIGYFLQGRSRGSFSPHELAFLEAVLDEQPLASHVSRVAVGVSQRDIEGVVEKASVRLLSPSAVPPQHRVRGLRDMLPMPRPLYSTDHAGVELHQRAAVTSQRHFQFLILVLGLELHLRNASPTLIQ